MAQFSVNPLRFDPYKNFKFRVKWDGRYVAGVSKMSALKRTTEVVKHREGGDPSLEPQVARSKRVRADHARARHHARHRVREVGEQGLELRLGPRRGDVARRTSARTSSIELYNEAGQLALAYQPVPLLGVRVPGAARDGRERERGRDPDPQARERGLGARLSTSASRPSRRSPSRRRSRGARSTSRSRAASGARARCDATRACARSSSTTRGGSSTRPRRCFPRELRHARCSSAAPTSAGESADGDRRVD